MLNDLHRVDECTFYTIHFGSNNVVYKYITCLPKVETHIKHCIAATANENGCFNIFSDRFNDISDFYIV